MKPKYKEYKTKFPESSLSRIWKHVTEHDSGTITSFRHASECNEGEPYSLSDNRKRNSYLKSQLLMMGYGVTAIDGIYIEAYGTPSARKVKEESFIVIDLKDKGYLKQDLIKLGSQYEQDSITFSKPSGEYYLISTNKCSNGYPGRGKIGVEIKLGQPMFGKDGEFHSKVNGRPFVFVESCNEIKVVSLIDYYPTEIRSIKAMAEEADKINYSNCDLK
jgi:hypothetical protein